jgi:carbamoyltransferase
MYILGISCYYHDSSACLVKDGIVVAAGQEERFSRKKHDKDFPQKAIEYCLESQGITINDINYVAFYEKPFLKLERFLHQHFQYFPKSWSVFVNAMPSWLTEKLRITKSVKKKLGYKGDVFFIPHHVAHAASSFLPSPFKKAAILTADGVGEWTTTSWGIGEGNNVRLLKEIRFPSSIGLLYSTITAYLGFSVNNSEYKVMGLAPYGNMNRKTNEYYKKLKGTIDVKSDGSYQFNMEFFKYGYANRMPSQKLCELFGGPARMPESELSDRHKDIASAVQLVTEDLMTGMLNNLYKETKIKNLVISGGVALNSVYNGKILKNTNFERIWCNPDPGDGGTSIGAALFVYNSLLKNKRVYTMNNAYLGPEYSSEHIKKFLEQNHIKHHEFESEEELTRKTAHLIAGDNVVGWFQGRMEWGPRALGTRSILSNATNPRMQEVLNVKVKHREKFRPFAPAVCADMAEKYFDMDKPMPEIADFMLMVYPVKDKWKKKIPAVTHVDGSGRLQTVRREQNPRYYDVIKSFGKLTGIPIIINTSFNIRGEPIVCTPFDAYRCMMGTGIDYLVIDKFLIKREDNIHDAWDSEVLAHD